MARVSRSNKKQPAFDPNELSDLIFTPAVGRGVGSHLFGNADFPAPPEEKPLPDNGNLSTVDEPVLSRVDAFTLSTVDRSDRQSERSTVDSQLSTTVDKSELPTVDMLLSRLWTTEHGDLVPVGRVKRIEAAADVINQAEQAVYDVLWTAEPVEFGIDRERESSRVVQAGYDFLAKRTHFAKRTIQRIVEKLIDKDFLAVERRADIYLRSSTVYRVFSYQAVLDRHIQKGRLHVAKLGPGFSYVRPFLQTSPQ